MTKHEWRERDEEGGLVYYRAIHHAGRWQFFSTRKTDPEWYAREALPLAAMESLREVLWNKHQRRRLPLKHLEQIEEMLERLRSEAEEDGAGGAPALQED
ncbi:MAG TPA: hypothetical protein PLA50_07310 [Bacteroidia bacterium]|nr:hypothetical protein [Bacteroidia bacterium]